MIYQGDYINFNSTGIYKITNIINGKFYIGSAISFRTRYNQHLSKLNLKKHHNKHLQYSYEKYGADNFEFSIIELCKKEEIYFREQYYLDNLYPEYNMQLKSGIWRGNHVVKNKGGFKKGYKPSEETLKRKAVKRRKLEGIKRKSPSTPRSIESRKKIGDKLRGRSHSQETIEKIIKTKTGISNYKLKGIPRTRESIEKQIETRRKLRLNSISL